MKLKRFYAIDGARVALIGEPGRIYTRLVYIDSPIRLHRVANGEVEMYSNDLAQGACDVKPAARKMLKVGKVLGIKKSAKKFLREILK